MPEIISAFSQSDAHNKAALTVREALITVLSRRSKVVLGVSGGSSPLGVYDELVSMRGIDWSGVHIFLIDEKMVDIHDNQSNSQLVWQTLAFPLVKARKLPKQNFHPVLGDRDKPDQIAAAYQQALVKVGGKFDVLLTGVGEDGHVGSLFPDSEALASQASYFTVLDDAPMPPAIRLTATKQLLQHAEYAVVLFYGQAKRQAYDNYRNRQIDYKRCPVKILDNVSHFYLYTVLN